MQLSSRVMKVHDIKCSVASFPNPALQRAQEICVTTSFFSLLPSHTDMAAFNTAYKALSVSSAGILILLIVVAVVVIAMIVIRRRSRSPTIHTDTTTRPSPPDVTTFHVNTCTDSGMYDIIMV